VGWITATASTISVLHRRANLVTFGVLAGSGFRRHATYRQATMAGDFTNVVLGFLRCYVVTDCTVGREGTA
jgi:ABC-2 type transport system permease protein